ncbi:hypothetical protein ACP70R_038254 [Stipagrostis hirtigluma subsp. patula]
MGGEEAKLTAMDPLPPALRPAPAASFPRHCRREREREDAARREVAGGRAAGVAPGGGGVGGGGGGCPVSSPLRRPKTHPLGHSSPHAAVGDGLSDPAAPMTVAGAAVAPCRPRSARYAEKGYPNYAEETDERRGEPRRGDGGVQVKKPAARRGRKRGRGAAAEVAGKALPVILQGEEAEEAEAQEGRKR